VIQFKPVKGDTSVSDGDLREIGPDGAIEEVLVHP
jgi:hypothetical protein